MTRPSAVRSIMWVQHAEQQRAISGRLRDFLVEAVPMALGFESKAAKDKRTSPLRNAMLEHVPVVIANSAEDEARQLLQAGAEIEHALLIEYLYAAFSMRSSAVRKTLINIAVQEMSHLIAVQNLLLFLGAAPYFERYDISPNPEFDPFPFGLNSFRHRETLERFVLAEMPMLDTLKGDDQATIIEIQKRLDPQARFHRVGVLYARIYWLFQSSLAPEGKWHDVSNIADVGPLPQWHVGSFAGEATFATTQASRDEKGLRLTGIDGEIWWQDYAGDGAFQTIDSRAAALDLLYEIAAQGEGLATAGTNSHFNLFFNELKRHGELEPDEFISVPNNPTTSTDVGRTIITDPIAIALCNFLNCRYQIMLISLVAALHCNRKVPEDNARRQKLAYWAFYEMKYSLRNLAAEIVQRPCKAGGKIDELCAGPTFDLGKVQLVGDKNALELENRELHVSSQRCCAVLRQLGFGVNDDIVVRISSTDLDRYPNI